MTPQSAFHAVMPEKKNVPVRVAYERGNRNLDPRLVWCGKESRDTADLLVQASPLRIQEKRHPRMPIHDFLRPFRCCREEAGPEVPALFGDFNGLLNEAEKPGSQQRVCRRRLTDRINRWARAERIFPAANLAENPEP